MSALPLKYNCKKVANYANVAKAEYLLYVLGAQINQQQLPEQVLWLIGGLLDLLLLLYCTSPSLPKFRSIFTPDVPNFSSPLVVNVLRRSRAIRAAQRTCASQVAGISETLTAFKQAQ